MGPKVEVLSPIGAAGTGAKSELRQAQVKPLKIGLLNNSKQNAGLLLRELGDLAHDAWGAEITLIERKDSVALAATSAQLAALRSCDLVLTGTGD